MDLITQRLKIKDLSERMTNLVKQIADKYNLKSDEVVFIRKGLTINKEDLKVEEGERAIISYITTASVDRDGEIVIPSGVDMESYAKNPVVLWGHDYKSLPIGRNEWIKHDSKGLIAKTIYAKHAEAEKVYQYRKDGFPLAESIGFVPTEWEDLDEEKSKQFNGAKRIYHKWVLLEYSDVPVPSNPDALQLAIAKGLLKAEKFNCECIECGFKMQSEEHCKDLKCPECGGQMRRVERPGPGQRSDAKIWEDEPEWTEIKYRVRNPDLFERIRRMTLKTDKPRIYALVGPLKGEEGTKIQALRFPKADEWTLDKAKKWVADHPDIKKENSIIVTPTVDEVEKYVEEQKQFAIENYIKEGRVLSTKTKGIIVKCVDALTELLRVNEPEDKSKQLGALMSEVQNIISKLK